MSVMDTVTKQLVDVLGEPRNGDIEAVNESFERVLSRYSPGTLEQATKRWIDNRETNAWPLPVRLKAICEQVQAEAKLASVDTRGEKYDAWSDAACRAATQILRTDLALAERAHREGVLLALWDFCRQHRRLPDEREYRRVEFASKKAQAEIQANLADDAFRRQMPERYRAFCEIWATMRQRHVRLAEKVFGKRERAA